MILEAAKSFLLELKKGLLFSNTKTWEWQIVVVRTGYPRINLYIFSELSLVVSYRF